VRFHQPSSAEKTTRRNEFEPRSMTAVRVTRGSALDELDPVAVGVAYEAQPRAALADGVGRLLGLDALVGQPGQRPVEVLDGHCDVVVAGAELVAVDAVVVRQLEAR